MYLRSLIRLNLKLPGWCAATNLTRVNESVSAWLAVRHRYGMFSSVFHYGTSGETSCIVASLALFCEVERQTVL